MESVILIVLVVIGAFVYLLISSFTLRDKINRLSEYTDLLEKRIRRMEEKKHLQEQENVKEKQHTSQPETVKPVQSQPIVPKKAEDIPPVKPEPQPALQSVQDGIKKVFPAATPAPSIALPKQPKTVIPPADIPNDSWNRIEKQLVENWTGILGAIIMVVGVGFLGIYAALKISAFGRFMLISGFSVLLGGVFFYLRKKENWIKFALWLRSSAGAIFLFACLGSAGIPGLKWVDDSVYGLLLLGLGIGVNLYLGFIGGNQVFASLHVVLSLIALLVAPQTPVILIIGGLVTLFGVALTYREKWDYHLLLTISSFFVFHLFWYVNQDTIPFQTKLIGIATVLLVSIAVALVHYRKVYSTKKFESLPFAVHLVNWLYFGIGLLLHSTGAREATFFIAGGSVAAYFLARRARKLDIRWLYLTDTLMAQAAALIALLSLYHWEVDAHLIMASLYAECLFFLFIVHSEKEEFLFHIGTILLSLSGGALAMNALATYHGASQAEIISHAAALVGCLAFSFLFLIYMQKKNEEEEDPRFTELLGLGHAILKFPALASILGALFGLLCLYLYRFSWTIYPLTGLGILFLWFRHKKQSADLSLTAILLLAGFHAINWFALSHLQQGPVLNLFMQGLPPLLLTFFAIRWCFVKQAQQYFSWIGVYLFTLQIIQLSYYTSIHLSPLLPGVVFLVLSLPALWIALYRYRKGDPAQTGRFVLHGAYLLLLLFTARHILFHVQNESLLGPVKIRFLIDFLALVVFLIWAFTPKPMTSEKSSWNLIHPLFPEVILIFSLYTILLEVNSLYHPLIWMCLSFALAISGKRFPLTLSRFVFYSILLYWLSAFQTAIISITYQSLSSDLLHQVWLWGLISILLQFSFILWHFKKGALKGLKFPKALEFFNGFPDRIEQFRNSWLFYPLIAGTGLFLYGTFDRSVLTFLWVVECFVIFSMSVFLKEKHFRYVSLIALGLCILRLIVYDLAQESTLTKALVFLGVGLLMLGMNSIYNKYKSRFE